MNLTKEEVINRIQEIHGNKYGNLQNIEYKNVHTKIELTCKTHGNFFITPASLFRGCGCRMCANKNNASSRKLNIETIIERANKVHNGKYIYDKSIYKGCNEKILITCPIHGDFWQNPLKHINGCGCPQCFKDTFLSFEEFKEKASLVHNNMYSYDKAIYKNKYSKICITCPIHGDFWQMPYAHIDKKQGCPQCGIEEARIKNTKSQAQFEKDFEKICNKNISIGSLPYVGSTVKMEFICKEHGTFYAIPQNILSGRGCPKCRYVFSKKENEVREFIETELGYTVDKHRLSNGKEVDIYIPSKNIGFEFNGLYWHCEIKKDKDYHINKVLQCKKEDITLYNIFEDEWINKQEIIKSKIRHLLGGTKHKIYARKCSIKEISNQETNDFLNENDIDGEVNSKYNYGLYYEDNIVSVMSFAKHFGAYNLIRFCSKINIVVVGGMSKLLNFFIKAVNPNKIITYIDKRWSIEDNIKKIGFTEIMDIKPQYSYIISHHRENKIKYTKKRLIEQGFDCNKTEHQIMLDRGIYRIYDCGYKKFEMNLS